MPRPRRPFSGQETLIPIRSDWMSDVAERQPGVRQAARWVTSANWAYRTPNGIYDPLTMLKVLDAVAHIDPDIELRSQKMAEFLNVHSPRMLWDAITVGKVLADLCEAFEDVLGPKMGLLERGKDYRGAFYLIHRNADTAKVYFGLRDDLMRLAEDAIAAQANMQPVKRHDSPLLECPSVRGEFSE